MPLNHFSKHQQGVSSLKSFYINNLDVEFTDNYGLSFEVIFDKKYFKYNKYCFFVMFMLS